VSRCLKSVPLAFAEDLYSLKNKQQSNNHIRMTIITNQPTKQSNNDSINITLIAQHQMATLAEMIANLLSRIDRLTALDQELTKSKNKVRK